jgi:hypothetical protein
MENPPAVLIHFIETKRRPLPKGYIEAKKERKVEGSGRIFKTYRELVRIISAILNRHLENSRAVRLKQFSVPRQRPMRFFRHGSTRPTQEVFVWYRLKKRREEIRIAFAEEFFHRSVPTWGYR